MSRLPLTASCFLALGCLVAVGCAAGPGSGTDDSPATGGAASTGGVGPASGGAPAGGASAAGGAGSVTGGQPATGGGASVGGTGSASGGAGSLGGSSPSGDCAPFAAADPALPGPYETITEENVGPLAGVGEDDMPTDYTVFRPAELGQDGVCHPVITWGNGTGSTPNLYKILLNHLASHGFIVIGSNSENVAQGDPPPMVIGAEWVVEQNADASSPYFGKVDVAHVGATGHSQGGMATSTAGRDPVIKTMAPLCGAMNPRDALSGPAFFFCGGLDDVVSCDGIHNAFAGVSNQPAMFANYLSGDHANWITFFGDELSPVEIAVTAWMRVHLMNDTALRGRFYGPDCELCTDDAWEIEQSMMD